MKLRIEMGLAEFPNEYANFVALETQFTVYIQAAACDCSLLVWDIPTQITMLTKLMDSPVATATIPVATVNTASRSAEPAIRSCYPVASAALCTETSTYSFVEKGEGQLPTPPMTMDLSTFLLTV
jgi:hypothetical protein